jgi:hypothetical protein
MKTSGHWAQLDMPCNHTLTEYSSICQLLKNRSRTITENIKMLTEAIDEYLV